MPRDQRKVVSAKQEKDTAKRFGAQQHKGSGSGHRPQDMHTKTALIECKTVLDGKKQITITDTQLSQLERNAAISDQYPILHIRLAGKNYVLLTETDYLERVEEQ